jgi:SAM-dependent methyltransferase
VSLYSQFTEHYETIFPFRHEVYSFLRRHLPSSGTRVLDIGCGPGHYCGRFAADGFEAVGIDLDATMIAAAGRRYPQASFIRMDMRDVHALRGVFDLVFCIGNVAAHVDREALRRVALGVRRILRPAATWVIQVVNWDYVLQQRDYAFRPKPLEGGRLRFLREYRDITESGVRFITRLVADERTLYSGEVKLYPLRAADCELLHMGCGFALHGHFADFKGAAFVPTIESGSVFVFRSQSG